MENEKISKLFSEEVKVLNVGLMGFKESLGEQKVKNVHVDWKPPAGGNRRLMEILARLK